MNLPEEVDILINPISAVTIAEHFFTEHQPTFAKEDWVKANAILIESKGKEVWLSEFLKNLEGSYDKLELSPVNPYHAVTLHDSLRGSTLHVNQEDWVRANAKLLNEVGSNEWLWRVLEVMETDSNLVFPKTN